MADVTPPRPKIKLAYLTHKGRYYCSHHACDGVIAAGWGDTPELAYEDWLKTYQTELIERVRNGLAGRLR